MEKRWMSWVLALVLVLVLAACGGDDQSSRDGGSDSPVPSAATPAATRTEAGAALNESGVHVASGRSKEAPRTTADEFESPFSAGDFVRDTIRGIASAPQAGGQMATYKRGDDVVVLHVLFFDTTDEAVHNVRYTLEKSDINLQLVGEPYYSERRSFGITRDRHGGHTAAWNTFNWVFTARSTTSLDALNAFLDAFPY